MRVKSSIKFSFSIINGEESKSAKLAENYRFMYGFQTSNEFKNQAAARIHLKFILGVTFLSSLATISLSMVLL